MFSHEVEHDLNLVFFLCCAAAAEVEEVSGEARAFLAGFHDVWS